MGSGILGQEERLLEVKWIISTTKRWTIEFRTCRQRGCLGIKSENLWVWWGVGWAFEKKEKKALETVRGPVCQPLPPKTGGIRWNSRMKA